MRKFLKITICIVMAIVALLGIITLLAPSIVKSYVEKHSVEIIGRQVTLDRPTINLFNGHVRIDNFSATETDLQTKFLYFQSLDVRMRYLKLIAKDVDFEHITLTGLDGMIVHHDTTFNFSDIITRFAKPEQEKDTTPSKWDVFLNNISIKQGNLHYTDLKHDNKWSLKDLTIDVPGIYFGGDTTKAGMAFNFTDGGRLVTKVDYNIEQNRYGINLQLTNANLNMILPFLNEYVALNSIDGLLSGNIRLDGSLDRLTDLNANGDISIDQFAAVMKDDRKVLQLHHLGIDINHINPYERQFIFGNVVIDSLSGFFERYKEKTIVDEILAPMWAKVDTTDQEVTTDSANTPINLAIEHIALKRSSIDYYDLSLFHNLTYKLTNIHADVDNFDLNGNNNLCLRANLPKGGSLMATWKGGFSLKHDDQHLQLIIKNLHMEDVSQYVEYYTANSIEGGTLSFVSENNIRHGMLDGNNRIDIYQCIVGKKDNSLNAEYKAIPVKLAISLLQDLDKRIEFNVPISGDINSPKFSYSKIVWKAIGNILLKATASPFILLAKAVGIDGNAMRNMVVNPLQPDFSSKQYAAFSKLVDIAAQSDEMKIILTQEFDLTKAINELSVFNLKKAYYYSINTEKNPEQMNLTDWDNIMQINENDAALKRFTNKLTKTKNNSLQQKANIYNKDTDLENQIMQLAQFRNKQLVDYLVNKMGMNPEQLDVRLPEPAILKQYKAQSHYNIEIEIPENANLDMPQDDNNEEQE